MKVFIVHRDVINEFGEVINVFSTKKKAKEFIETECNVKYVEEDDSYKVLDGGYEYIDIQEWDVIR